MRKFLKKIVNDERPIEFNILAFACIYMILFITITTPLIIYLISINPKLSSLLTSEVSDVQKGYYIVQQIRTMMEFVILGTVSEFFRRKKSIKFKWLDDIATKFYLYYCGLNVIYIILIITEVRV